MSALIKKLRAEVKQKHTIYMGTNTTQKRAQTRASIGFTLE
jgi:hypothetical protein